MPCDNLKREIFEEIAAIVGPENILNSQAELICYSYDASLSAALPCAVIHFDNASHISPVVKVLSREKIHFTARAAGTNLCGAAVNLKGGVILNLSRLKKIRQIDTVNKIAVVEPGVVNWTLQQELAKYGFFYAPDPASQKVCTIGGNIAQNAGGPQCLKYGVTCDHVEKLEIVLPDGEEKFFSRSDPGPDMISLFCQSEGTLGIIKTAWLKILPVPESITTMTCFFDSVENSMKAVSEIIAAGIIPRALEEVDALSMKAGIEEGEELPENAHALLLLELEGKDEKQENKIKGIFSSCGGFSIESTSDSQKREKLWKLRKESYPALARIAENVMVEDGVVPRPLLPEAVKRIKAILEENRLRAGLIFHAGDGNIHPNIVFDQRDIDETRRAKKAGEEILKVCIELSGDISGEHGIGVEKRKAMNWRYDIKTLELFSRVKKAIDPLNLSNPDKKLPVSAGQISQLNRKEPPLTPLADELLREIKARYEAGICSILTSKPKKSAKTGKVLSSYGLDRVIDFDRGNMTVTVESAITCSALKNFLKENGLDVELPAENISLGSAVALKRYCSLRGLITGMDIALSNGDLVRLGGKTIKSVSGYNLAPVILGSRGALAFILSLTLKVKNPDFSKSKKEENSQDCAPESFSDPLLRKIKKAFDPLNLFNPHIFGEL
ncbi:MAG: hypothetical protein Fur0012_13070 [Elusimicrobiota bacterium]